MSTKSRTITPETLPATKTPTTIGIIMDGNRRWAIEHGLPKLEGHRRGLDKVREMLDWAREAGIKNVVVFALSTENLKRTPEEVAYYYKLIRVAVRGFMSDFKKKGGVLHVAGDLSLLPKDTQEIIEKAQHDTAENSGLNFYMALAYGGRNELVTAIKKIVAQNPKLEDINDTLVAKNLLTYPMPDPDLIIRTSGEQRLSGFLPWQSVYSELFFTKTYGPAFSKKEFLGILKEYETRERRMGR